MSLFLFLHTQNKKKKNNSLVILSELSLFTKKTVIFISLEGFFSIMQFSLTFEPCTTNKTLTVVVTTTIRELFLFDCFVQWIKPIHEC